MPLPRLDLQVEDTAVKSDYEQGRHQFLAWRDYSIPLYNRQAPQAY